MLYVMYMHIHVTGFRNTEIQKYHITAGFVALLTTQLVALAAPLLTTQLVALAAPMHHHGSDGLDQADAG